MGIGSLYKRIIFNLPEVKNPDRKSSLKNRLFWTGGILVLFYVLSLIPLYGITEQQASYFEGLSLLFGASFGKLLTLGIGPIVTASIILQLLVGAGILKFDMTTEEGKAYFTGTSKLFSFIFIILESFLYVKFQAISPDYSLGSQSFVFGIVFLQLVIGGFLVYYMDEIIKRWGIGSGISLFIAAGVAQVVFLQAFSPLSTDGTLGYPFGDGAPVGKFFAMLQAIAQQQMQDLMLALLPILITIGLYFLIVYFQSIRVEIPLSLGRMRGKMIKWPLNFFYTSNIPVILVAALAINIQWWANILQSLAEGSTNAALVFFSETVIGQYAGQVPISGLVKWISPVRLLDVSNLGNFFSLLPQAITYSLFMIAGATLFSVFWVQTAGLDPKSQTRNLLKSGLRIPGFRADERILERILARYIMPLTVMGGIVVGALAAFADTLQALSSGTGILLLIMIIYQFYELLVREAMQGDAGMLQSLLQRSK